MKSTFPNRVRANAKPAGSSLVKPCLSVTSMRFLDILYSTLRLPLYKVLKENPIAGIFYRGDPKCERYEGVRKKAHRKSLGTPDTVGPRCSKAL